MVNTPIIHVSSMEHAVNLIMDLRERFRTQGQQVITYRRKLRQQKVELCELRHTNRQQLEEISSQLLLFESNLRGKEKQLQDTLNRKDQVISKQQRVIRRLLRKCYGADFCPPPSPARAAKSAPEKPGSSISRMANRTSTEGTSSLRDADYDAQNDSDSAIMLEDNITEVSLLVPNISFSNKGNADNSSSAEVKVVRSISDVIKAKGQQQQQSGQTSSSSGRKTKEERRISNRQKLLTIAKRHSGFLKRPEILETVYSVEEDAEGVLQQQFQQQQQNKEQPAKGDSTESSSTPPRCVLTGFRNRLDSDMTASDDLDYSTDDDSTRIFYSETDGCGSGATSVSQSRRSSYGGGMAGQCSGACSLPCSRRSSYGHSTCQCSQCSASSPCTGCSGSRRSSYGSHANLTNSDENDCNAGGELKVQTAYNRVMSNHRAVTKVKDVKFKRINKAKSRSLEELRGKLRWQMAPSIVVEECGEEEALQQQQQPRIKDRSKRGRFQQCMSLDHQSEA